MIGSESVDRSSPYESPMLLWNVLSPQSPFPLFFPSPLFAVSFSVLLVMLVFILDSLTSEFRDVRVEGLMLVLSTLVIVSPGCSAWWSRSVAPSLIPSLFTWPVLCCWGAWWVGVNGFSFSSLSSSDLFLPRPNVLVNFAFSALVSALVLSLNDMPAISVSLVVIVFFLALPGGSFIWCSSVL